VFCRNKQNIRKDYISKVRQCTNQVLETLVSFFYVMKFLTLRVLDLFVWDFIFL